MDDIANVSGRPGVHIQWKAGVSIAIVAVKEFTVGIDFNAVLDRTLGI